MCIILNNQDDKLADKFKKDPVKFYKMSSEDILEIQKLLGLDGDHLSGII